MEQGNLTEAFLFQRLYLSQLFGRDSFLGMCLVDPWNPTQGRVPIHAAGREVRDYSLLLTTFIFD